MRNNRNCVADSTVGASERCVRAQRYCDGGSGIQFAQREGTVAGRVSANIRDRQIKQICQARVCNGHIINHHMGVLIQQSHVIRERTAVNRIEFVAAKFSWHNLHFSSVSIRYGLSSERTLAVGSDCIRHKRGDRIGRAEFNLEFEAAACTGSKISRNNAGEVRCAYVLEPIVSYRDIRQRNS